MKRPADARGSRRRAEGRCARRRPAHGARYVCIRAGTAVLAALTFAATDVAPQEPPGAGAPAERVALRNVTVVDVTDGSLHPGRTVVIEGGRISRIGPTDDVVVAADTRVVDAAGGYLIPGLWDMHAHALGSQRAFAPMLKALLANGVTGIRDPQHSSLALAAMIRPALRTGAMPGPPRLVVAGNQVDGAPPSWPGVQVADSPDRGRAIVDSLVNAGAPFIKVYSRLRPATYQAIAARSNELGIPFVGHVPATVSAADASAAGQRSFEHLLWVMIDCSTGGEAARDQLNAWLASGAGRDSAAAIAEAFGRPLRSVLRSPFDEQRCRTLLSHLAANETWQVPTLLPAWAVATATDSALAADPRTRYVPRDGPLSYWEPYFDRMPPKDQARRMYDRQRRIAGMLEEHDVPLLVGTDMPAVPMVYPGFGVHDEMKLLTDAGLSPLYVLRAATLNPARFLELDDSLGTVAVGKRADLVLLEANPLEDIANVGRIRAVVANGRLYDRADLDALFDEVAATSARHSIATILQQALDVGWLEAARQTYRSLRGAAPDSVDFDVWHLGELGHALVADGRLDEARAIFEWNVEAHPASPYPHAVYAWALERMGRAAEAAERWSAAAAVAERLGHPALDHFRAQAR
jgi:hypothetical protein